MLKNRQFTFGALLSYGAIAFNIVSGLLYTPWMIKTIGDDQYALYTLSISIINIFLVDFGIGSAVAKFLSNYYARGQQDEANLFMGIVYKVFIAISFVIATCLTVFYFFINIVYKNMTVDDLMLFKQLFIIVGASSVLTFPFTTFNSVLMANERFIEVKMCNLMQKVLSVIFIVIALISGRGIYALVLTHVISNFIFLVLKYYFIRRNTRQRTNFVSWDKKVARSLFGYSSWYTLMNIAQRCIFNVMPTIIVATIGTAEVTIFTLASILEGYVFTFADAVNGMFMPKVSRILVQENADHLLTKLMTKVGRFHVFTIGLIYIGFISVGQDFVYAWMGPGYEKVFWCAVILILPSLFHLPQQVARTALLVKGDLKAQGLIYSGMALANLVLSFVCLNNFGIIGAAISVCVAYMLRTLAMNILYHKKLLGDLKEYFKCTYGRWSIVAIITLTIGLMPMSKVMITGWTGVVVKSLVISMVYLILYGLIGVNGVERKEILDKIRKRG